MTTTKEERHAEYKITFGPVQSYIQETIIELVKDAKANNQDATETLDGILNEVFTGIHHADWDLGADGREFLVRLQSKISSYLSQ